MRTVHILGIITVLELIISVLDKQHFEGISILLWVGYGMYKLITMDGT